MTSFTIIGPVRQGTLWLGSQHLIAWKRTLHLLLSFGFPVLREREEGEKVQFGFVSIVHQEEHLKTNKQTQKADLCVEI